MLYQSWRQQLRHHKMEFWPGSTANNRLLQTWNSDLAAQLTTDCYRQLWYSGSLNNMCVRDPSLDRVRTKPAWSLRVSNVIRCAVFHCDRFSFDRWPSLQVFMWTLIRNWYRTQCNSNTANWPMDTSAAWRTTMTLQSLRANICGLSAQAGPIRTSNEVITGFVIHVEQCEQCQLVT